MFSISACDLRLLCVSAGSDNYYYYYYYYYTAFNVPCVSQLNDEIVGTKTITTMY